MRTFLYISLSFLLFSCSAQKEAYLFTSFREPANEGLRLLYSYNGYQWQDLDTVLLKPAIGKDKVLRDPSMLQGPDGTFHLVWTTSWRGDKGFGYASSKDLLHWSEQQLIPVMQQEPTTVNVWAPELFYDEQQNQYVVVWASTIPGRFEKGMEADSNNHRLYYTVTKDFKNYSLAKLFFDPGYSVIDAVIVKKGKVDYVQVVKDNTRPNRNIKVAFANNPLGPYTNVSAPFTASFTEGPTVLNKGKEWLIYFDAYGDKKYSAVKTTDFRSFTDVTAKVIITAGHKHGTIIAVHKKVIQRLLKDLHK
jgi:hypothetical protein